MSNTANLPNNSISSAIPVEIKIENQFLDQDIPVIYIVNQSDADAPSQQIDLKINLKELNNYIVSGFGFTPPTNPTTGKPSSNPYTAPNNCNPADIPGLNQYNLAIAFRPGVLLESVEASLTNQLYEAITNEIGTNNSCIVHGPVTRSDQAKVWYLAFQNDLGSTGIQNNTIRWEPFSEYPPLPAHSKRISIGPDGTYYASTSHYDLAAEELIDKQVYFWNPSKDTKWQTKAGILPVMKSIAFISSGEFFFCDHEGNFVPVKSKIDDQINFTWKNTIIGTTATGVARASGNKVLVISLYQEHLSLYDPVKKTTSLLLKATGNLKLMIGACELIHNQYLIVDNKNNLWLWDNVKKKLSTITSDKTVQSIRLDYNNHLIALGTDEKLYKYKLSENSNILSIPLKGISARAGAGARVSQLECQVAQLSLGYNSNLLTCKTSTQFNIVNHQGNTYAPMHFGVIGNNTMLHMAGQTIVNTLKTYFLSNEITRLTLGADTKITLAFPYNDQSQQLPAFGTSAEVTAYQVANPEKLTPVTSTELANDLDLTVDATIPYAVIDPMQQKVLFQFKVKTQAVGDQIDQGVFEFSNLQVSGYQGVAFIQVSVQNLPGYWDSVFQIPIVIGTSALTGQLDLGTALNSDSNTGSVGSRISFLTGGEKEKIPTITIEEDIGLNLFGVPSQRPVRIRKADLLVPEGRLAIGVPKPTGQNTYNYPANTSSACYVQGDSELHGALTVSETTTLNGPLTNANQSLQITGSTTISEDLNVRGTTHLNGPLTNNNEKIEITGSATVSEDFTVSDDLTVSGTTELKVTSVDSLRINKENSAGNSLSIGGGGMVQVDYPKEAGGRFKIDNDGNVTIGTGNISVVKGTATFNQGVTIDKTLVVKQKTTLKDGLECEGANYFNYNTKTTPSNSAGGTIIGYNRTSKNLGETDFFNLFPGLGAVNYPAFNFYQIENDNNTPTASCLLTIARNGYVGIGTQSPGAPMHVYGNSSFLASPTSINQFTDMHMDGDDTNWTNHSLSNVAIWGTGYIVASKTPTTSDARIKKNVAASDRAEDLERLLKIQIANFNYIDHTQHDNRLEKGLIAQEVEKAFPEAVHLHSEFIPNIYAECTDFSIDEKQHTLTCRMENVHDLEAGDQVRMTNEKDEILEYEVASIPDKKTFVLKDWKEPVERVFIYGKKVDDFRTVDYHQVAMLGISATQELHKEVADLKQDNAALRQENQELKDQLQKEMTSMKEQIAALQAAMKK